MTWLLTATGQTVDLAWLDAESISIDAIAHHLAQLNRFTGACSRPYSVAEHSLLVCEIVERERAVRSPAVLMAALLHDAHEAYCADISSPMKQVLGDGWRHTEHRIAHSVRARFAILSASAAARQEIEWADLTALATERAQLLPACGPEWPVSRSHPPVGWVRLADRDGMTWRDWRQAFLDRFAELSFARNLQRDDARAAAATTATEHPFA
jgi:hypothetical protein